MTLVRASPRASLSHDDLGFAQELAARAALALDNSALYRRAREAVRVRDEFLCIASHELNTPLTTLSLRLDSLMRFGARDPPERIRKSVVQARRQVGRLCRLVESLLDVTQIDTGRLRLRPTQVDLVATAREVVDQLSPELSRAGCVVNVEAPASVIGHWDPTRIGQVLLNLLFNACKYGAGRPIDVIIHPESDRASLSVRDQGIGIAPEDLGRLFRRFERAAPYSNYGGLGLGLYITRHIIEAHGGTIRIASTLGRGTTFSVELPLHQASLSVEGEMPRAAETPSEAEPRS